MQVGVPQTIKLYEQPWAKYLTVLTIETMEWVFKEKFTEWMGERTLGSSINIPYPSHVHCHKEDCSYKAEQAVADLRLKQVLAFEKWSSKTEERISLTARCNELPGFCTHSEGFTGIRDEVVALSGYRKSWFCPQPAGVLISLPNFHTSYLN